MFLVTCGLPNNTIFLLPLLADMKKPKLAAEIAKQLREFHQVEIPGSQEPQLWNDMFKFFEKGSLWVEYLFPYLNVLCSLHCMCSFFMVMMVSSIAASALEFDDGEKQRIYETISFKEIKNEIIELKVVTPFIYYFEIIIDLLLVYTLFIW